MVESINSGASIPDKDFENALYANYKGILVDRISGRPSGWVEFEDARDPNDYYVTHADKMKAVLKQGEEVGYELPQIRLARAELASAQRWHKVTRAFNKINDGFSTLVSVRKQLLERVSHSREGGNPAQGASAPIKTL